MQKKPGGSSPDFARNGACVAQAAFRWVMMAAINWNRSIRF
jgi:hypothetical protein